VLGYVHQVGQSGWQILGEADARLTHPSKTVSVQKALAAADKTALKTDFDEFSCKLSNNNFISFITIGASFRFRF